MTVRKVTGDVGKGAHCATDTSRGILASVKWKKVMKWKKVRGFLILFNALLDFSFKALRLRLSTIGCWAEHLAWTAHSVDKGQRDQRDIVRTLRPTTTNNQQQEEEGRRRCSWSCERTVEDMEAPLDLSWKLDDTWHPPRPAGRGFGDHLRKKRCIRSLANKSEKLTRKYMESLWKDLESKQS